MGFKAWAPGAACRATSPARPCPRQCVACCTAKPIILASGAACTVLKQPLKFQPDQLAGTNVITRHAPGEIWVGNTPFVGSLLVPWKGAVLTWRPAGPEALSEADFEAVLALKPELVIFGSGPRLKFVSPALTRCLIDRRIGVETMDTAAACRTYNVLATEGRSVVAALLLPPTDAARPARAGTEG